MSGVPTGSTRVEVKVEDLLTFYNVTLPNAIEGINPALVFNMDEMGAERYADAKHVHVFVPGDFEYIEGMPIGVPRSSRRVTLMVCIVLDGSRLTPAVVIKNVTVNSLIFENGYSPENLTIYTTANSFVTGEVFGRWLRDVFIPNVEAKREALRQRLGTFDERAVLILDGCSSHKKEEHRLLLESKNITMMFLVPHSSHLTQPLDLCTFGRVKIYIRDQDTYAVSLEEFDEALDDIVDVGNAPRRRAERGKGGGNPPPVTPNKAHCGDLDINDHHQCAASCAASQPRNRWDIRASSSRDLPEHQGEHPNPRAASPHECCSHTASSIYRRSCPTSRGHSSWTSVFGLSKAAFHWWFSLTVFASSLAIL